MSTIKPKMVVTMNLKGDCETGVRTRVETRGNTSIIDEPIERGGTNQGMSPAETVMAALLACTNRITHTLAERHGGGNRKAEDTAQAGAEPLLEPCRRSGCRAGGGAV